MNLAATIKELRELMTKGSPTPWKVGPIAYDVVVSQAPGGYGDHSRYFECPEVDDAALIAAMRNALPELLDAAERWGLMQSEQPQRVAVSTRGEDKLRELLIESERGRQIAEVMREDRIDLDVAKRTVMLQAERDMARKDLDDIRAELAKHGARVADFSLTLAMEVKSVVDGAVAWREKAIGLTKERDEAQVVGSGAKIVVGIAQKVVGDLREALRVYGGHIHDCAAVDPGSDPPSNSGEPCTCGFKAAWDRFVVGEPDV